MLVAMAGCGSDDNPSAPAGDTVAPTVSSTNPINGATGVAVITASFSEAMNASTITTTTFTVTAPGPTPVTGTVTYNASTRIAKFTPTSALAASTSYTATITTGAKDVGGNGLATNHVWSFTTSAAAGSQASVVLGAAGAFAVLAGSTVTSTGATALTGDLGVSPGTAVTGFPPGTVTGATHAGDATSATAMIDLTTAYADAAGRTVAPVTVAGNLGGLTLPPGLYKSTSSLSISSGDLTLDAQGDANAVFIFQMASTLTTTSGRAVILSGGAKASNVFWQVGSSATLGTTSAFKGTIMADQSITLGTGATLEGRALARIGAVTLAGNTVVVPAP
ncbi:MAG TPA: ice-binding family protein [Candidatus Eisenbacteria bacterium]|nr:ice-binding family protein [Candidatus Eisenbacteria bacterium]